MSGRESKTSPLIFLYYRLSMLCVLTEHNFKSNDTGRIIYIGELIRSERQTGLFLDKSPLDILLVLHNDVASENIAITEIMAIDEFGIVVGINLHRNKRLLIDEISGIIAIQIDDCEKTIPNTRTIDTHMSNISFMTAIFLYR